MKFAFQTQESASDSMSICQADGQEVREPLRHKDVLPALRFQLLRYNGLTNVIAL